MKTIKHYEIELSIYHDEVVGRIQFVHDNGGYEQSSLYSLHEINNILKLWKDDGLCGSFGIGTMLDKNATFDLVTRG